MTLKVHIYRNLDGLVLILISLSDSTNGLVIFYLYFILLNKMNDVVVSLSFILNLFILYYHCLYLMDCYLD